MLLFFNEIEIIIEMFITDCRKSLEILKVSAKGHIISEKDNKTKAIGERISENVSSKSESEISLQNLQKRKLDETLFEK